jgi:mRNA interferase MazF
MNSRRGDVVILDYPFSDSSGAKVRPALIVQSDPRNAVLSNTIVALITKNLQRSASDPTQLLIDIATPHGMQSGLHRNSAVTCGNLYTVHERHILKTTGSLSAALMLQVDLRLKAALDLP